MASYTSYRNNRISGSNIANSAIENSDLQAGVRNTYDVKWVYGAHGHCSSGCCCEWVVPSNVKNVKFELWGAGGNGHGACSCNRCHHFQGAGGGNYNTKTIESVPGCSYTVCAGGVYPCLSRECTGCNGCTSYVTGYNLSNFCARGGSQGRANTSWNTQCFSTPSQSVSPGEYGGEFAEFNHRGSWGGAIYQYPGGTCHCWKQLTYSSGAAMLDIGRIDQFSMVCWIRCGCWCVPYGAGGQGAHSSYCGRCCGQGGTGGSGVVKITYF